MKTSLLLVLCITLWTLNWVSTSKVADRTEGKPDKLYKRIINLVSNKKIKDGRMDDWLDGDSCGKPYEMCSPSDPCCERVPCVYAGMLSRGYCDPM